MKTTYTKCILLAIFLISGNTVFGQSAKELIGKWKLVKETKDGKTSNPENTYQVFFEDGTFEGIKEDKSRKGKWKLSKDGKQLIISISIVSVKFSVDYFDSSKRVISSEQTGTLEYNKVK